jgi:hypothetical protein
MAIHSSKVAEKIRDYMGKNNLTYLAVPWGDFYTLVERGAIRKAFQDDLVESLKKEAILIAYGQTIVSIMKDYAPPNVKHDFK